MAMRDATIRDGTLAAARPTVELACAAARVVFTWQEDRWRHCLTSAPGAGLSPGTPAAPCGWQSLDTAWPADADPRWPASPVLVELSRVDRHGKEPAILGVGMAGRSHYSASIARDPSVDGAVRFEIACRLHDGPGWLGSTYRQGPQLVRIAADVAGGSLPRTVEWSYSIGPDGLFGIRGATVSTSRG